MKIKDFFRTENSNNGDVPWRPSYRWMGFAAGVILLFLIIVFFALNIILKPYMREIPASITPWLDKSKKEAGEKPQPGKIEQDKQNDQVKSAAV